MIIRIIKTKAQHQAALAEIARLARRDPAPKKSPTITNRPLPYVIAFRFNAVVFDRLKLVQSSPFVDTATVPLLPIATNLPSPCASANIAGIDPNGSRVLHKTPSSEVKSNPSDPDPA